MGLAYKNGKYAWPDGSTLPTDEIIRWDTSVGSGACGGFHKSSGFWIKLSCTLNSILISCEKEVILPVNEKIGQLWTVITAASLSTTSSKLVYKSDYNTRFDCLMACNEEIRFTCISFAFDTNTKDCILYSTNTYSKNTYLKRDVDDEDKLYFETIYPGECFQRLIEERVLGIKWNVSSEYDLSTDKSKLPLHLRKGPKDNVALGETAFQKTTKGDNKANLAIDGISLSGATLGYCAIGEFTDNPWEEDSIVALIALLVNNAGWPITSQLYQKLILVFPYIFLIQLVT
ncbi:DgyrCDS14574 [Dimorphilus gyrociliatus]|uniref:DgyrCDS14574 n=1 Tax=Dimorphilus gyrociliatus TaxID=2664684 RepID=A0A7I8WE83_9ANNE|nr:DgyrCDS14574 [Dimorphilus gyrociliatus]